MRRRRPPSLSPVVDLDYLPPVIQIILREPLPQVDSFDELRKYLRKLLPELRRQAQWTVDNYSYQELPKRPNELLIAPTYGLDPFSNQGKCMYFACRLQNAEDIARTIGLYADIALIPDTVTAKLATLAKLTEFELFWLFGTILLIKDLQPLLLEKIFRFYPGTYPVCANCYQEMKDQVSGATDVILNEIREDLSFEIRDGNISIGAQTLFGPPLHFHKRLTSTELRKLSVGTSAADIGLKVFRRRLQAHLLDSLQHMSRANSANSIMFSNAKLSLLAARHFERGNLNYSDIELWEASRSAKLPWIRDLSMSDLIRLRNEASDALPRFRRKLADAMVVSEDPNDVVVAKIARELSDEADEVDSELRALKIPEEARFNGLQAGLGMTICLYGFATQSITAGLALLGLSEILRKFHSVTTSAHGEFTKVSSKPGYVLLKARELSTHAHD